MLVPFALALEILVVEMVLCVHRTVSFSVVVLEPFLSVVNLVPRPLPARVLVSRPFALLVGLVAVWLWLA